jgi:hypothetical protein
LTFSGEPGINSSGKRVQWPKQVDKRLALSIEMTRSSSLAMIPISIEAMRHGGLDQEPAAPNSPGATIANTNSPKYHIPIINNRSGLKDPATTRL